MSQDSNTFLLQMVTPAEIIYQKKVKKLIVSTLEGEITILPDHTPLVAAVKPGEVEVVEAENDSNGTEKTKILAISEGVVEIRENRVRLLVQVAEKAEELNKQKIIEATKIAEEMIERAKKGGEEKDFTNLRNSLKREIARLRVYERYQKRKNL